MTREELERLSKEELIELILDWECRLDKRQLHTGPEKGTAGGEQSATSITRQYNQEINDAERQQKFRERATRKALRNLDNIHYLEHSALAKLITQRYGMRPGGEAIQLVLYEAVDTLQAIERQPSGVASHLPYSALRQTCLEKAKGGEIAKSLFISERQYYRVLKAAIRLITDLVLGLNLKGWQKSGR